MQFSVLISLYYREKPEYLRECLRSLAVQTKAADQIVLVYDGEVGAALEAVVAEFTNLPLEIVRLPENIGLGRALNAGLDACRHEWVFRMDTDDICISERFEKQCAYIETNPEIDLFGGQIAEFSHDVEQPDSMRHVPLCHREIKQFAKKRNPFNHMTVAYRKNCVMEAGSYQHHLCMEDYNLWLRMLAHGAQTANLPDVLVQVRGGEEMLARRNGWAYLCSEWQLFRLKQSLQIHKPFSALNIFLFRSIPRLLPTELLRMIYHKFLRKKK